MPGQSPIHPVGRKGAFDGRQAVKSAFALLLTRVTEPRLRPEEGDYLKRTISVMVGHGSVNHNSRKFHAKNTDQERSHLNINYCHENIKAVYHGPKSLQ